MTRVADHRTGDILAAMQAVAAIVAEHGLEVTHADFTPHQPGASAWNPETRKYDLPVLPKIQVSTPWDLTWEFVRWADALGATKVTVERRELDTILWVHVRHGGFSWTVSGYLSRPEDGGPRLPGATVEWERTASGKARNHGWTTVADVRAALTALGEE